MANKEFQVRHGLAVNNTVLVANTTTGNVGVGTNTAAYQLDVIGAANISQPTLFIAGQNVLASIIAGNTYAGAMANSANVFTGTVYTAVNSAFAVINAAFGSANTALQNTTGTFAGTLTTTGGITANGDIISQSYNTGTGTYLFISKKSRGTPASPTTIVNGDTIGGYLGGGYDGATYQYTSAIEFFVDGVVSTGTVPQGVRFSTGRTSTYSERFRVDSNGNVGIGTASALYKLDVAGPANISVPTLLVAGQNVIANINGLTTNTTAAFGHSNTTYTAVNSAFVVINAAFGSANTIGGYVNTVGGYANTAGSYANTAGLAANQAGVIANAAFGAANQAGVVANNSNTWVNSTFVKLTAASQTITGDLSVTGNLTFLGNSVIISSNSLVVGDSLIYLAANNYSGTDLLDIGFIANYGNTTLANVHTGLIRDATNKMYYLFQGYDAEPANNSFVPGGNNMTNAVLNADLITSNLTLGGANANVWIAGIATNAAASFGLTNLTYTAVNSAFAVINAAFGSANTIGGYVNTVGGYANTAGSYANTAGLAANQAGVIANTAFGFANGVSTNTTAAFGFANGVATNTTAAFGHSNATYTAVNSAFGVVNAAYNYANTSAQLAYKTIAVSGNNMIAGSNAATLTVGNSNGIVVLSNTVNGSIQLTVLPTGVTATTYGATDTIVPTFTVDAYGKITSAANVTVTGGAAPFGAANQAGVIANAAFGSANTAGASANTAGTNANTAGTNANTAGSIANTAWTKANGAVQTAYVNHLISGTTTLTPASNNAQINIGVGNVVTLIANTTNNAVIISLPASGVTATNYGGPTTIPTFTVDAYGRITAASNSGLTAVTSIANGSGITGGTITSTGTFAIDYAVVATTTNAAAAFGSANTAGASANTAGTSANTAGTNANQAGVIANSAFGAANQAGVIANAAFGAANVKVETITSNSTSRVWANSVTVGSVETVYLDLATSGVTATTYGGTTNVPVLTVDAYGRITSASNAAITSGGSSVAVSDTAPGSPTANSLWWSSSVGRLFIYYNDGNSSQWVDAAPANNFSTFYVGTTAIALNRTSAAQTLTGITSIDGTANNSTYLNGNNAISIYESLRANRNLTGGGTITVDASYNVLWSTRFIVLGNGRGTNFSTAGYWDITCPVSGTITGVGGAANQTAAASGIPLAAWTAIYYIMPIGSGNATVAANFRLASYTADVDIPHDWLLICWRNGDDGLVYFNNGIRLTASQSIASGATSGNIGPGAGSYSGGISALTLDAQGRVTAISGSAGYITSAGNAATVGGFTPSQTNGTANRVVVADASGYINNNYFNSTDDVSAGNMTYIMGKFGDNYYRSATAAKAGTFFANNVAQITPAWRSAGVTAFGPAIADYFGATSSISLAAGANYIIEMYCHFTKTTAGTVTWTPTFSSAPTLYQGEMWVSPITGLTSAVVSPAQLIYQTGVASTGVAFTATGSLTTAVNHLHKFRFFVTTNLATNFRIKATQSAGTMTPLAGSFYTATPVTGSFGSFAA